MTCTDNDIMRLKEYESHIGNLLIRLLLRLEAAENNMRGHVGICHRWYTQKITDMKYLKTVCVCGKRDTEKAWRKAAGK